MKFKEYKYKINGTKFTVKVGEVADNQVQVEVNGVPYNVELEKEPGRKTTIAAPVKSPKPAPRTETGEKIVATKTESTGTHVVKAPLPGTIMSFAVKVGDVVKSGDTVCVLEAMKMENDVHTAFGGKVVKIIANVGDAVPQDGDIMVIE